jgi:uncharacterized FAD-dependent dehydrogenase
MVPTVHAEQISFVLRNLLLLLEESEDSIPARLRERFSLDSGEPCSAIVIRKGIDARKKNRIKFIYTVEFSVTNPRSFWEKHSEDPDLEQIKKSESPVFTPVKSPVKIIIVGSGPAGLFAALRLQEYGLTPILLERGRAMEERIQNVNSFWTGALLDEESNIQFGEGGAGTFSDGKLTTRVRDANISYVLNKLVIFGAPDEICWLAKPHIGTDRLRSVVVNMRRFLESRGVDIRFRAKLTGLQHSAGRIGCAVINNQSEESCEHLILAPGHSARDTYTMLFEQGIPLEAKPFAVGLRIEHPQELINLIQYGLASHPNLPPADYALAYNDRQTGRSAYTFCMCPGGVVVAGSSEKGGVVTNGMSSYGRNGSLANSALVATVQRKDFNSDSPLAGIAFQRGLEKRAFLLGGGNYHAPAQNLIAFLGGKQGPNPASSYRPGVTNADLAELLPPFVTTTLRDGIAAFERKMRGFITAEATLTGVESRTSAPVRILRGENLESIGLEGLFPCGEGAGYAGGIMSAALDGIRVADAIAAKCLKSET